MNNLSYYRLLEYVKLDKFKFKLVRDIYLVKFTSVGIADPNAMPICTFYESGIRKYMWNDHIWSECEICHLELGKLVDRDRITDRAADLYYDYKYMPLSSSSSYNVRAIYKIED